MHKNKLIKWAGLALVPLVLSACGGSSSSSSGSNNSGDDGAAQTGQFVDSYVSGVRYSSSGGGQSALAGTTNSLGVFQYRAGQTVSFALGNISLGSTNAQPLITPVDLTPSFFAAGNMAAWLLTLDQDGDPDNGITIPALVQSVAASEGFSVNDFADSDFRNSELADFARDAYVDAGLENTPRELVS